MSTVNGCPTPMRLSGLLLLGPLKSNACTYIEAVLENLQVEVLHQLAGSPNLLGPSPKHERHCVDLSEATLMYLRVLLQV